VQLRAGVRELMADCEAAGVTLAHAAGVQVVAAGRRR